MSKQSISATPPKIYGVIVIGAGSVRLRTALGLRQRGIRKYFRHRSNSCVASGGASNRPSSQWIKSLDFCGL